MPFRSTTRQLLCAHRPRNSFDASTDPEVRTILSYDELQSQVDSPKDDYEETVRSTEESSLQIGEMLVGKLQMNRIFKT